MHTNFSPISFNSTYRFDFGLNKDQNDIEKHWQLEDFCDKNNFYYNAKYYAQEKNNHYEIEKNSIRSYAIIDDKKDSFFEKFCASKGINYNKLNTQSLLNEQNIISRVKLPHFANSDC